MKEVKHFLIQALATGLFLSYIPARLFRNWRLTGAGLVGSLWGIVALPLLPTAPVTEACVLAGAILAAVSICDVSEILFDRTDDPRIVIDEFVGTWMAVASLPRHAGIIWTAFILFRILDASKPPLVREAGLLPGGWGVVMDDVVAGLFANLLIRGAQWLHIF